MAIRAHLRTLAVNVTWQHGQNNSFVVSLNMSVQRSSHFLAKRRVVSSRDPNAGEINAAIQQIRNDLEKAEQALISEGLSLTKQHIRAAYEKQKAFREKQEALAQQLDEQKRINAKQRQQLRAAREERLRELGKGLYSRDLEELALVAARKQRKDRYEERNGIVDESALLRTHLQAFLSEKTKVTTVIIKQKGSDATSTDSRPISVAMESLYRYIINAVVNWRPNLRLDETGFLVLKQFEETLKASCQNSSVNTHMYNLKSALNWCDNQGLSLHPTYKNYSPSLAVAQKEVSYCSHTDLAMLLNLDKPTLTSHQCFVRDAFVLACSTGVRFSDLIRLAPKYIDEDNIKIHTHKNNCEALIPLTSLSRVMWNRVGKALVDKNEAKPIKSKNFNETLRLIFSKLPGWNELVVVQKQYGAKPTDTTVPRHEVVSSHWGRKTFINLAIQAGTTLQKVMSMTGHKSESSIRKYIRNSDAPLGNYHQVFDYRLE